jgi:hypothetical protein
MNSTTEATAQAIEDVARCAHRRRQHANAAPADQGDAPGE